MAVDNVVRNWLSMKVEDDAVIHYGLRHALGWSMAEFYAGDIPVGPRDLEWMQGSLNVIIDLFCHIGLMANVTMSKMMTCQPGTIRSVMS